MTSTYRNAKRIDLGTSLGDVYTCPTGTKAIVRAIHCSNKDTAADQTIAVVWTDASDSNAVVSIAEGHLIPMKASYQILDGALVLEPGDKLRASAGAASKVDVTVSLLEVS